MELNPLYQLYVKLNDKVDNQMKLISSGVSGGNVDLSDIIVRLKALEGKVDLDKQVVELAVKVAGLEKENEDLKKRLEYLAKVDSIESRVYNLEVEPKTDLSGLEGRMTSVEARDYHERIVKLEENMGNMEKIVNIITDINYRLGELEKRPDLIQRLNAVEATVANLNVN